MTRRLPKPAAVRSAREGFDRANLECACLIAADPVRYQGALSEWADVVLSKATTPMDWECGPLFRTAA